MKNSKFITILLLSLCKFNFKSFKRCLIYSFHYADFINLRKFKSTNHITNEYLIELLEQRFQYKITKKELCQITNCSKNTFNKKLNHYFEQNNLKGRRTFSFLETYGIINEWQGDNKWVSMEAITKKKLAKITTNGDYKKLANELKLKFGEDFSKNNDKLSPSEVKKFLKHIDEIETEKSKRLLGKIDDKASLWIFTLFIAIILWERNKHIFLSNNIVQ